MWMHIFLEYICMHVCHCTYLDVGHGLVYTRSSQDTDNALLDEFDSSTGVPGTTEVAESTKLAEANASGNKQLDVYTCIMTLKCSV